MAFTIDFIFLLPKCNVRKLKLPIQRKHAAIGVFLLGGIVLRYLRWLSSVTYSSTQEIGKNCTRFGHFLYSISKCIALTISAFQYISWAGWIMIPISQEKHLRRGKKGNHLSLIE